MFVHSTFPIAGCASCAGKFYEILIGKREELSFELVDFLPACFLSLGSIVRKGDFDVFRCSNRGKGKEKTLSGYLLACAEGLEAAIAIQRADAL